MNIPRSSSSFLRALILPAISIALLSAGCANMGSGTSGSNASGIKQTHGQFIEGWNKRDAKMIAGAMHPDATFTSPNAGGMLSQRQFAGYLQTLFAAVPDFTVKKTEAGMMDKDSTVEQWVVAGTWTQPFPQGPLAGVPPTGKSFTLPGANFIKWRDGKMASVVQYFDNMSLLMQLGVIEQK